MSFVRPPAVAGSFYPQDASQLRTVIEDLLHEAAELDTASRQCRALSDDGRSLYSLRALQVPHAGYVYSGVVAAAGYRLLQGKKYKRIVIAGPTHRVGVHGIALSEAVSFATPLGEIPVDQETQRYLEQNYDVVKFFEASHVDEHSIEVQLPFLQTVLSDTDFSIVPLLVGSCPADQVSRVLQAITTMKGGNPDDTLILISSDLSHYLPCDQANSLDKATIAQVMQLEYPLDPAQACGAFPWSGMIRFARKEGLRPELLIHTTSDCATGIKDKVVGYSTVAFWQDYPPQDEYGIPDSFGQRFPELVRSVLENTLSDNPKSSEKIIKDFIGEDEGMQLLLHTRGAVFVTLNSPNGRLRGCVGTLSAHRDLGSDIVANAQAAALKNPRFPPVEPSELPGLKIEVSVLNDPQPFEKLPGEKDADYLQRLRPGIDGVTLRQGLNRATFLPQVWNQLPEPADFVSHLMEKAGIDPEKFPADIQLETYQVQSWKEKTN